MYDLVKEINEDIAKKAEYYRSYLAQFSSGMRAQEVGKLMVFLNNPYVGTLIASCSH